MLRHCWKYCAPICRVTNGVKSCLHHLPRPSSFLDDIQYSSLSDSEVLNYDFSQHNITEGEAVMSSPPISPLLLSAVVIRNCVKSTAITVSTEEAKKF